MVSSTVSRPVKHDEEGVSSNGGLADSRVASAAGEGTAETGIEVDSAVGEVVASTGGLLTLLMSRLYGQMALLKLATRHGQEM